MTLLGGVAGKYMLMGMEGLKQTCYDPNGEILSLLESESVNGFFVCFFQNSFTNTFKTLTIFAFIVTV